MQTIGQGHRVSVRVAGNRRPFLKHGRDTVFRGSIQEIKKGDIVFYTRPNGHCIMHRVWRDDGRLDISGDAQ